MDRRTFLTQATGGAAVLGATGVATASEPNASTSNQTANGTSSGTNSSSSGASASGGGETHTVGMYSKNGDVYFDPVGLHVKPGDTVEWVIKSGGHSVTSYTKDNPQCSTRCIPKKASSFNSGILKGEGKTFEHTFTVEGTYDYYCIPHKQLGMVGRIVCGDPGGPATEGSIPDKPGSGLMPSSKDIVDAGSISYPYIPSTGSGGPPALFWAGTGSLALVATYLLWVYDRRSGRYGRQNIESIQE
ncbi:MAG: plastocyanin/azurin family copper-binding protein [Halorientalis sp.]